MITAALDKNEGDTEEDRRVSTISSKCFDGGGEGERQIKIEVSATQKIAKRMRETSGEPKTILQSTPGHDSQQKSKDREWEQWERIAEKVTRHEAWAKMKEQKRRPHKTAVSL